MRISLSDRHHPPGMDHDSSRDRGQADHLHALVASGDIDQAVRLARALIGTARSDELGRSLVRSAEPLLSRPDRGRVEPLLDVAQALDAPVPLLVACDLVAGFSSGAATARLTQLTQTRRGLAAVLELERMAGHRAHQFIAQIPIEAIGGMDSLVDDGSQQLSPNAQSVLADVTERLLDSKRRDASVLGFAAFLSGALDRVDGRSADRLWLSFHGLVEELGRTGEPIADGARELRERHFPDDLRIPGMTGALTATLLDQLTATATTRPLEDLADEVMRVRHTLAQNRLPTSPSQRLLLDILESPEALAHHVRNFPASQLDDEAVDVARRVMVERILASSGAGEGAQLDRQLDILALLPLPKAPLIVDWLADYARPGDSAFHARIADAVGRGTALRQIAATWRYLGPRHGMLFLRAIPDEPLLSAKQWRDATLPKIIALAPHFPSAVIDCLHERLAADGRGVRLMAEAMVKSLLLRLPEGLQSATYGQLLLLNKALEKSGNRSATLAKFYGRKVDEEHLSKLVANSAHHFGPDIASAIVFGRALKAKTRGIDSVLDKLRSLGEFQRAHALIEAVQKGDRDVAHALDELEIALAIGERDKAVESAQTLSASATIALPFSERFRLFLVEPVLKRVGQRAGWRLGRVDKPLKSIARRIVAARASTLVGQGQEVRARFESLARIAPRRFACAGIGAMLVVGDFEAAEEMSHAYVRYLTGAKRRRRIGDIKLLEVINPLLEHATIQQKHFLNEGRDLSYHGALLASISGCLDAPLKPDGKSRKTIFVTLVQALRLSFNAVTANPAIEQQLVDAALAMAGSDDVLLARLSQVLDNQWQSTGQEIGAKALAIAELRLHKMLADYLRIPPQGPRVQIGPDHAGAIARLSLADASRIGKALTQVLSLAERQDDTDLVTRHTALALYLIDTAVRYKWAGNTAMRGLARRMLTSCEDLDRPLRFLELAHALRPNDVDLIVAYCTALAISSEEHKARKIVGAALERWQAHTGLLVLLTRLQSDMSDSEGVARTQNRLLGLRESAVLRASEDGARVRELLALRSAVATQEFWKNTSSVLQRVPNPQLHAPKGVVFASFYKCMISASITTMPFLDLKRRGYDVVYLNSGTVSAQPTGHPLFDQFAGILRGDGSLVAGERMLRSGTFFEWSIDPKNGYIGADGLNFHQPIFERLAQQSKSFTIDFDSPLIASRIRSMVRLCDRGLYVARRIRDEVAARGIPVRFVSSNWQYPPYCTFRIAAAQWSRTHDISFVAVSPGYESYFSNLGKRYATTAAAVNMSLNPNSRAPFLPRADRFRAWYAANGAVVDSARDEIEEQIRADRAGIGTQLSSQARDALARIKAHRRAGGKVVCAFGKIVYDLAVPYSGGPAHGDIQDYLNHTIEAAAKAPGTLVLIKPHPHELRYEIARNPRQFFTDLIKVPIPDNVLVMGHRWFNVRDLIPLIDLGVLWNGTSCVELAGSGVPVVMCDDWGPRDYPVGFTAPRSREHYEQIIRDPSIVENDPQMRRRCIGLLKYLSTTDVMRPYQYVERGLVNVDVGAPVWRMDDVERYLREGDPYVEALASDFMFPEFHQGP